MALSNAMASLAAAACSSQLPISIPRHRSRCSSTPHSSLGSTANVCPQQTILSAKVAGLRCGGCMKAASAAAAAAAARNSESDCGMERLQEEDLMELEFGRMLGESPDATMKKVLARKSNPSLDYIDIEKSIKKQGMKPDFLVSMGSISEYIKEHRQMKNQKGRDKDLAFQTVKGDLPKLLRPLPRPNTCFNESQVPTEVVATPKSETRGSYVDLIAKPVPIKQKGSGLPPVQPEMRVIPPVLIRRKGDQSALKQQSAEPSHQQHEESFTGQGLNALRVESPEELGMVQHKDMSSVFSTSSPELLISTSKSIHSVKQEKTSSSMTISTASGSIEEKTSMICEQALNFSSPKKSQSGLLKSLSYDIRKSPTLLSKPSTPNPLSSAETRPSSQVNSELEKETKSYFVRASQDQLRNNNVDIHAECMSESMHFMSSAGGTFDGQVIRLAEQDALQSETMFIEKIKASGQIHKSADKLNESVKLDSIADQSVHAGKSLKKSELINPSKKPSMLDMSFETHSERHLKKTNTASKEGLSSPTKSTSSQNASHISREVNQVSPLLKSKPWSPNTNLRKPDFNMLYGKKDDNLVNNEISDCLGNEEGDSKSENKVDDLLESKHMPWEIMSFLKQPKIQVPSTVKADVSVKDLIRQHYPPFVASPDPLLQNRPGHEWPPQNDTSPSPEDENEDQDWARVEALKCTRAVVEVKLTGINSGGMLASLGSLVGFLPVKELGSSRGLRSFAVWTRERGYSIPQGQMKEDVMQTSNELETDHLLTKLEVDVVPHDRKKSLDGLRIMYRKEKAEHLASLVGEKAKVVVTYVDRDTQKLLVSERQSCDENLDLVQKKVDLMANLKVGDIVTCSVKQYATFGIFVDLQGVSAFIHRSELSWNAKVDPSSFFHIGQEIQAVVADLNYYLQRINLSMKRLQVDPLYETLESLSVAETNFIPDVSDSLATEAQGSEVPELEALFRRLKESKEIIQVVKGRCISTKSFVPEFQVYLSTHLESGYKLLARFGNEVQEIYVKTELPKENVKNIISSSVVYDGM